MSRTGEDNMRRNLIALALFAVLTGLIPIGCASGPREPSAEQGETIFEGQCSECHNTTRVTKVGPGLRSLMKREINLALPNKMPPTEEGVRTYLLKGAGEHPTFADLSEGDMDDLIAYLKTL